MQGIDIQDIAGYRYTGYRNISSSRQICSAGCIQGNSVLFLLESPLFAGVQQAVRQKGEARKRPFSQGSKKNKSQSTWCRQCLSGALAFWFWIVSPYSWIMDISAMGRRKVKLQPWGTLSQKEISPLWASTILEQRYRPRPIVRRVSMTESAL